MEKNGASSLEEMRARTEKYRRKPSSPEEDYQIGCILLEQPFFFKEKEWIPVPLDWKANIVQGKRYDTSTGLGKKLWEDVELCIKAKVDLGAVPDLDMRHKKLGILPYCQKDLLSFIKKLALTK